MQDMGLRPLKPCTSPGCQGRSLSGRCDKCLKRQRASWDRQRGRAIERYGPSWPSIRMNYLLTHPRCALCGHQATVPDHWPLSRRYLIRMRVPDPDADHRLRPLCAPCHNAQTAANQPGGWARDRR